MKRRARGSLTIEAVLLFPLIFCMLIALLQSGFYLTYRIWLQSLCDQGVCLYAECMSRGEAAEEAEKKVREEIEKRIRSSSLQNIQIQVRSKNWLLFRSITVEAGADFSLLYRVRLEAYTKSEYYRSRNVRDTIKVVEESIKRIPGLNEGLHSMRERVKQWLQIKE